jgi:hypothetical protein
MITAFRLELFLHRNTERPYVLEVNEFTAQQARRQPSYKKVQLLAPNLSQTNSIKQWSSATFCKTLGFYGESL